MNRRYVYILTVALGVLTLIVVGLLLGRNVRPVPPELVGRWRLAHFVVDTQVHPPHSDKYMVTITVDKPEGAPPFGEKHPIGYMEWSDGCNTHWATFKATRAGKIQFAGEQRMTIVECGVRDKETGKWTEVHGDEGILLWPDDAVAYELLDGQLWLYTSQDKANALVLE